MSSAVSCRRALCASALVALSVVSPRIAFGAGALNNKSGAIQITTDGQFVWAVNPDFDSVSRLRTADNLVTQFNLPPVGVAQSPQGLAITPNGAEVWVAAQESDRIYVLDAASGAVTHTIDMPFGSGPVSVAISPDGSIALVALFRTAAVAECSVANHSISKIISELYFEPFAITFVPGANRAWVAHRQIDGEHSFLTVIDTAAMNVANEIFVVSTNPKFLNQIPPSAQDPNPIPEGGYIIFRSHMAMRPNTSQIFVPLQYHNFHTDVFTPDSSIQSAVHRINVSTMAINHDDRVVLSAVKAHNNSSQFLGDGWNAGVSGPIDIAFSADGNTCYIAHQYSNDVVVMPATTTQNKPTGANPLKEINVGDHPIGLVASPIAERLYVLNELSRDVSVIDLVSQTELVRVPLTTGTSDPRSPQFLLGAKVFNTSVDPRASANHKLACASCHPSAETDGLPWDFAQLGNGKRKTLHLRGLSLAFAPQVNGRGQLHRSGDRDEVQDFDLTFRGTIMGGAGYLASPNAALGPPNAGLSSELDALATYLLGLPPIMRSPERRSDGSLSAAAKRGAMIFADQSGGPTDVGCTVCHPAPNFTDLGFHDVGGFATAPEHEGPAFNTPSLVGGWAEPSFRQAIGVNSASSINGFSMGDVVRDSHTGTHGHTAGLNRTQARDLESFLNSIDGLLAASGTGGVTDDDPPHVVAVKPVSLNAVEVIFDETVDPATAADTANYVLTDGHVDFHPTAAIVNTAMGNRVRLAVALAYPGCNVTYTLLPGPIEDVAGSVGPGAANNVLDMNDISNRKSFVIDGTITVTFGDVGDETFPAVAKDASFIAGQNALSTAHVKLNPAGTIEQKGFVRFDFVPTLTSQCGVSNASAILDARFSGRPDYGNRNTLEIRRCLMPWGDPPQEGCNACAGSVTQTHSTYNTIPWHQAGAKAIGGSGTSVNEYYPTGTFDITSTTDATVAINGINERVEFASAGVTDAFKFWLTNPTKNFGYCMEINGNVNNTGVEFWPSEANDGREGFVLSVTFAVPITPGFQDCNANGIYDGCEAISTDVAGFAAQLVSFSQDPVLVCMFDQNGDGFLDGRDIAPFVVHFLN